ncbi:MAG: DNA-directed RNA polymerase subunit beta [Planctomycetes bacterium]|nr:DNA-directed RNA polymerase subunit beta [Planctomycetota bacterium]MCW8136497.1 DNA-directed RNA polymerase subunit beta [Planctomycetota bacterium]
MPLTQDVTPIRRFGKAAGQVELPNLVQLQTESYARFLQADVPQSRREEIGLQSLVTEIFPIYSYDQTMSLEFLSYDLGEPRYTPDECRALKLTYGAPLVVKMRLNRDGESVDEDVYLGELPLMIGGGEFIINGAERVIVSQLHRSPGVDFGFELSPDNRKMHSCWVIPERGSWIELAVTKKDTLSIRIDQSGKFSAMTFFRAMSPDLSTSEAIIRQFYETQKIKTGPKAAKQIANRYVVNDVTDPETGEILAEGATLISSDLAEIIAANKNIKEVEVIKDVTDPLILNSLQEDPTTDQEEALERIYLRLRPGNPVNKEKAAALFAEKFYDETRYRLGRVGRFRLNRKFGVEIAENAQSLLPDDVKNAIDYILALRRPGSEATIDDIDHLGNRRVKTIDELVCDELRKGFLKLKKNVQERMNLEENPTPRNLINAKTISTAVAFFFGRGELSQVVDQTNPLSQLTHERRLSALGPGGLNRKRAGFEVRDVHISHYGRICPIETPEGTNIGLISSLCTYAQTDEYGFLVTPYRAVKKGKVTDEILYLRADEEVASVIAPADAPLDDKGNLTGDHIPVRIGQDFKTVKADEVELMDVSSMQMVGVSASLIPFLEHDDANRALMGSNMQRQAVPLVTTEPPIVGTGMERHVAYNSGMVVRAVADGVVRYVDSREIIIGDEIYTLRKFVGLNERTCLNQVPVVKEGDRVKKGDVIADGAATHYGELALGRNILLAFMPWDGYNFEDAILVSEQLLHKDTFTSIHIEEFEIEIRETKLGREEFTNEIPHVGERQRKNLDEGGVIRVGTKVGPGDILVGKVAPKSKSELTPEEKLLYAIFGKAGEDVKNDSLEVPAGSYGVVIKTERFSKRIAQTEEEKKQVKIEQKQANELYLSEAREQLQVLVAELEESLGEKPKSGKKGIKSLLNEEERKGLTAEEIDDIMENLTPDAFGASGRSVRLVEEAINRARKKIRTARQKLDRTVQKLTRGDELPTGVLEKVRVELATKRQLSVGDKFAGRHGNKGVVSKILKVEDMPFLEDGTTVQMVLNPLGVPSRMNVGQLFELHLGLAARKLGFRALTPVFNGATEDDITRLLGEAGYPTDGKLTLYDGRTGQPFEMKVSVGYMYMLKLHHLVDDKVHARATGPYSLITQQPLGGKARSGGQRFGEMEVWALEAYGAANILQELLTVKSDDVEGRTKIYESMVKGENVLEPGTPVSFDVLVNEIKGLALNIALFRPDGTMVSDVIKE